MTNAGRSVVPLYLPLARELVIRQSVQGSGLGKQFQVKDKRVTEVRSTSKRACLAWGTGVTGTNSWDCRCTKTEGVCALSVFVAVIGFHYCVKQQLTLEWLCW